MRIKLHPRYGVNATCGKCFWCGKDDGTLALLGARYESEAPRRMVLGYHPCKECEDQWAQGIVIIEASRTPICGGQAPIALNRPDVFPSGAYVVVTEDYARRMFTPEDVRDAALKHRKALMEPEAFRRAFGAALVDRPPGSEVTQ